MIKLHTALGRFEMRRNKDKKQYPVAVLDGKEYLLDICEMIMWSGLAWAIQTTDELREIYETKLSEAEISAGVPFSECLDYLENRGLVISGTGYTGMDALYALTNSLYVIPVNERLLTKILAFLHLTFIKNMPFKQTKKIFITEKLTGDERFVLDIISESKWLAGELIHYCSNTESAADCGENSEYTDFLYPEYKPALQAVINLYLKKLILFEKLEVKNI